MQFAPMLADDATAAEVGMVVQSDDWALESKINGHRRVILVSDGVAAGFNRKGEPAALPASISAELAMFVKDAILDGELIGSLWVCFDLLTLDGGPVFNKPWARRRALLERLFAGGPGGAVRLVTAARSIDEKYELILQVKQQLGEGLVAKDVHASYHPGPNREHRQWLKLKHTKTVDCVAMQLCDGRQHIHVGLFRPGETEPTEVCKVSRLTGDGPRVQVGDVVEVTALYGTIAGRLVQAVTPRLRDDKSADECTFDQLERIIPRGQVI